MAYRASPIKSIQTGTITIANASNSNTATITAVVVANTVLMLLGQSESSGASGDGLSQVAMTNSTTVTATRTGVAGSNIVSFAVVEYYPRILKSVQEFSAGGALTILDTLTSNTTNITAVNTAKSYINHMGQAPNDNSSGNSSNWLVRLVLTNSTTVTGTRGGTTGNTFVNFQVVEFN